MRPATANPYKREWDEQVELAGAVTGGHRFDNVEGSVLDGALGGRQSLSRCFATLNQLPMVIALLSSELS